MDLNKVMLIGRVTQDPEVRTTSGGQTVVNFSLVTNRSWKNDEGEKQEQPEFHNIVAWRGLAEVIGKYAPKGKQLYIEGRLQTRNWEGKDGVKRYTTEIVASDMILLGGGNRKGQTPTTTTSAVNEKEPSPSPQVADKKTSSGPAEEEINIEDIPF
jgi:single-strand DNA-binding protein